MYRRFLNDNDYLSIITLEALSQITRGNKERFLQAEESSEMSIVEYLSENYEIEKEFNKGKYIAEYNRSITYPIGVHIYLDGKIYEVIRSISGFKAPADVEYWEEYFDIDTDLKTIEVYSQMKTYYVNDIVSYQGYCYKCLNENGYKFGNIRIPLVNDRKEIGHTDWQSDLYSVWDIVHYDGAFYTLLNLDDFDNNVNLMTRITGVLLPIMIMSITAMNYRNMNMSFITERSFAWRSM